MAFLVWLEQTALATWVGESLYGYPFLLSMHVTGLALIVGISSVINLSLLGVLPVTARDVQGSLLRLAWAGFAINALSGIALFTSQATYFVTSAAFLSKLLCIICGIMTVAIIQSRCRSNRSIGRVLPAFGLLCWLAAIAAGRLIAYL
ncbi:MAG: hypothetical protein KJO31_13750 [Gammaproteobacteria bacterium]|nr:hypothetical protein [Gammaproteobacteria bacterium]